MKSNAVNFNVIDPYFTLIEFDNSKQGERESGLARASSTHDADLLADADLKVEIAQDRLQVWPISDRKVNKLDVTVFGPFGRDSIRFV